MHNQDEVIDLTQTLGPETVVWPGDDPVSFETTGEVHTVGSFQRKVLTPEHAGTHIDAPAHYVPDGITVEQIPVERLVVEAAVLDASQQCERDSDHAVEAADLEAFESRHGRLPNGGAVLLHTGWSRYQTDPQRMLGGDSLEDFHFPGFAGSAAELMVERGVVGIGVDTISVDPGVAAADNSWPVHNVAQPAGLWLLEGLSRLERLPPTGATIVVGALPLAGGSGAPARVLALVPADAR